MVLKHGYIMQFNTVKLVLCCSSKILTQDKEHFARLAVDAVLRLKGSSNLESIHIIKKTGGTLKVLLAACLPGL